MSKFAMGVGMMLFMPIGHAAAQDYDAVGRAKLAEMGAFIRQASEPCGASIPAGGIDAAFALYVSARPPITETEIAAKETEIQQYRSQLGLEKWCQLYAIEMNEAHIILELLSNQNKSTRQPPTQSERHASIQTKAK
jgi:hypothetical protein